MADSTGLGPLDYAAVVAYLVATTLLAWFAKDAPGPVAAEAG